MFRKTIMLILGLGICLYGYSAWADDDAVIDIDNHVATYTGTWGTNNTPILFYGDDFRWAACSGGDTDAGTITAEATFSSASTAITADITGQYAVYVRWVVHPNRTDSARYRIFNGTTQVGNCTMNQQARGGEWVYCTTVTMTSGNNIGAKLGNNCETGKYVIADAVRFVRVSKDKDDIVDAPGVEYTNHLDYPIPNLTTDSANMTTIATISVTAPGPGYIIVNAKGPVFPTVDNKYAALCLSSAPGGSTATCDSWTHYFVKLSGETTFSQYDDLSIGYVYNITAQGTYTYYLKGWREDTSTLGNILIDSFNAIYVPVKY